MLGGSGFYRASTILLSGTAGTGKTSLASHFANAACTRGERCLYFAFEESEGQIVRNMASIGLNLGQWIKKGLLRFHMARPTLYGLEMHLATMHKLVEQFKPSVVVLDPMSGLAMTGNAVEIQAMIMRLVDYLKQQAVTAMLTSLTSGGGPLEQTDFGVSSLVDAWLVLKDIEYGGERNRALHILKTRGLAHSNQVREFRLTNRGIDLADVYVGAGTVLAGSARLAQEAREQAAELDRRQKADRKRRELQRKRLAMEARIAAIRAEFDADEAEATHEIEEETQREESLTKDRERMKRSRKADAPTNGPIRGRLSREGRL